MATARFSPTPSHFPRLDVVVRGGGEGRSGEGAVGRVPLARRISCTSVKRRRNFFFGRWREGAPWGMIPHP